MGPFVNTCSKGLGLWVGDGCSPVSTPLEGLPCLDCPMWIKVCVSSNCGTGHCEHSGVDWVPRKNEMQIAVRLK